MERLGIYTFRDGKLYDLLFFPSEKLAQAVGPLPDRVGAARVAFEVFAETGLEAKEKLLEAITGIKSMGSGFVTSVTSESGATTATTTTLPPEVIQADPNTASMNASELILKDNPLLEPIKSFLNEPIKNLLSGVSLDEKLNPEIVRKIGKVEINFKFAPNVYVGRDAYIGEKVGAMGPGIEFKDTTFNQIWDDTRSTVDLSRLTDELRRLSQNVDNLTDSPNALDDAAFRNVNLKLTHPDSPILTHP